MFFSRWHYNTSFWYPSSGLLLDALENQHFPHSTASARSVPCALVFAASSSRVPGTLGAAATINGIVVTLRAWWWRAPLPCLGSPGSWAPPLWEGESGGESWDHGCLHCSQGPGLGHHCFPGSASSMCSNLPMFKCTGLSSILVFCDPLLSYVDWRGETKEPSHTVWCWCVCMLSGSVMFDSLQTHGIFQARILERFAISHSKGHDWLTELNRTEHHLFVLIALV